MTKYPKKIKQMLREWMMEAHERELDRELKKLNQSFEEWRRGLIRSGELSIRVHEYEVGPSKELFEKYNYGYHDFNVAYAIVAGILQEEEVPEELLDALDRQISFYQTMKEIGELKLPE